MIYVDAKEYLSARYNFKSKLFDSLYNYYKFQILPQMLNYLKLDQVEKSIDWGTMAIFTCSKNCSAGDAYKVEYVVKQDIVE